MKTTFPPFFSLFENQTGAEKTSSSINKVHAFSFLPEILSLEVSVHPVMENIFSIRRWKSLGLSGFWFKLTINCRLSFFEFFFSPKRSSARAPANPSFEID